MIERRRTTPINIPVSWPLLRIGNDITIYFFVPAATPTFPSFKIDPSAPVEFHGITANVILIASDRWLRGVGGGGSLKLIKDGAVYSFFFGGEIKVGGC